MEGEDLEFAYESISAFSSRRTNQEAVLGTEESLKEIRKLQTEELTTVNLFRDNTPSVVNVTNLVVRQDAFTLDVLEVFQGSGSD